MFVDEKIEQIAEGFDLVIRLENGKVKK
jgi:hypothetical protein